MDEVSLLEEGAIETTTYGNFCRVHVMAGSAWLSIQSDGSRHPEVPRTRVGSKKSRSEWFLAIEFQSARTAHLYSFTLDAPMAPGSSPECGTSPKLYLRSLALSKPEDNSVCVLLQARCLHQH